MRRRFDGPAALRVDVRWFRLWDKRPATFWVEVARRVKDRRVKRADLQAVRSVCADVENLREWRT